MKVSIKTEINQMVSQNVKDVLSQVLIDYLWSLVWSVPVSKGVLQIFKLSSNKLSERDVQDIVHMAYDIGFRSTHRVFGVTPVNEEIHVIYNREMNSYYMIMSKEDIFE